MNAFAACKHSTVVVPAFIFIASAFWTASSLAGTLSANNVPTITVDDEGFEGPAWEYSPAVDVLQDLPERGHKLGVPKALEHIQGNRADVVISQLEFDPDPFVLNNVLITNTTGSTQIYTVGIGLPTVFPGPNIISGNVRTDAIDGGEAPGATVATVAGFPIYTAQIDFVTVATLQNDPFSVVAPPAGSASAAASFGPIVNAMSVASNIGIQLRFSLTAGDTASILSRFDVNPVPEPASLGLSIVALLVTATGTCRRAGRG